MQVKVLEDSVFERTLEVVLEKARVDSAYDKAFGKAARSLALPGFRRGKVPLPMAKKFIPDERLSGDVIDELVPQAFNQALRQEKLAPISEPKWELVQRQRGKDLIFKVKFEVKPSLPIENYKGSELKAEEFGVSVEQVEEALQDLRRSRATLVPVDNRPLQDGDSAYVDYVATVDGEEFEGGKAENSLLEMKKENFIPGFLAHVEGLEVNQEKEFDIEFPAEYPNATLAGRMVHFKFKVNQLKERRLPELTDEFAKAISGLDTVEALRTELQERLQGQAERQVRESVSMRIMQKLLPQVPDTMVPRSLFSWRTQVEIRRRLNEIQRNGVTLPAYLQSQKIDEQTWVNQQSYIGMMEARIQLLLESIAEKEDLGVRDAEVEQLFAAESAQRGITVDQLKKMISEESSEELVRYAILSAKVRDFLFENAVITFVPRGTPLEDPPAEESTASQEAAAPAEPAVTAEEAPKPSKPSRSRKAKAEEVSESVSTEAPAVATEEEKPKPKRASKKKVEE